MAEWMALPVLLKILLLSSTGRGVFAKGAISRGQFVAEYRGDMINDADYQRRRRVYHRSCAAFHVCIQVERENMVVRLNFPPILHQNRPY